MRLEIEYDMYHHFLSSKPHYILRHIKSNLLFIESHYTGCSNMLSLYITHNITSFSFYEFLNL